MVHILSQINPFHNFPPYFPKIYSHIIFLSIPIPSEWSNPFRFSEQNSVPISHLSHACYMPPYLILLDLVTLTIISLNTYNNMCMCSYLKCVHEFIVNKQGYQHVSRENLKFRIKQGCFKRDVTSSTIRAS
jgi:hypothetical protein